MVKTKISVVHCPIKCEYIIIIIVYIVEIFKSNDLGYTCSIKRLTIDECTHAMISGYWLIEDLRVKGS